MAFLKGMKAHTDQTRKERVGRELAASGGDGKMTIEQLIEDLKVMIKADTGHLAEALEAGNRVHAHQFVDSIIDLCQELEDLTTPASR